jgi:hypothetical protein
MTRSSFLVLSSFDDALVALNAAWSGAAETVHLREIYVMPQRMHSCAMKTRRIAVNIAKPPDLLRAAILFGMLGLLLSFYVLTRPQADDH